MPGPLGYAAVVPRFIASGGAYWLRSGRAGGRRPLRPRRYGIDRQATAGRHAVAVAFYGVALAAWSIGATRRRPGAAPPSAPDTVRRIRVLDAAQCALICDEVHALRRLWVRRLPDRDFHTLGRAGYLDCLGEPAALEHYRQRSRTLNAVLRQNFTPLYERLAAALSTLLEAPCRLAEDCALPGFHVWLGAGIPRIGFDAGSVHFDMQYINVGLVRQPQPTADVVSFTLPLRLPRDGGGLNVWDIVFPQPVELHVLPYRAAVRVPYTIGELVLHTGHELHQIAPVARIVDGDERICLQGHGLRQSDGSWLLYW